MTQKNMNWHSIENLVNDNYSLLEKEQVLSVSEQLLSSVDDNTSPLQAARMTYLMVLLELKSKDTDEEKALHYIGNLTKILKHEITETEYSENEGAQGHLLYVRKLSEHYFHHIALLADKAKADRVYARIKRFRIKNHQRTLDLQPSLSGFRKKEEKLIKKTIQKHYVFMGFLFAIALFFAWNSIWNLTDFAVAKWVTHKSSTETLNGMIQQGLMLTFSMSFIWAFSKYQKAEPMAVEEAPA
ncbi:MAG: hypothetical protein P1V18_00325 [Candidatus Gracilibacteria bacterium]|nr:hypothetical protein [Candidatus Gracilibacteria bacterium]